MFVGTPEGTQAERIALANALQEIYAGITANLGKRGRYAEIQLNVKVIDGRLSLCDASVKKSFKPNKD